MTWPFVGRAALEAQREAVTLLRDELRSAHDRYEALVERMLQMRRDGFVAEALPGPAPEQPDPLPLVVEELLDDLNLPPRQRYQEERRARSILQAGAKPEQVVEAMINGTGVGGE